MNFRGLNTRERRNFLKPHNFIPLHPTIANYNTDSIDIKTDMKFDETLLSKIHAIQNPLKKNLADSVIVSSENKEKPSKMQAVDTEYYPRYAVPGNQEKPTTNSSSRRGDYYPSLTGITNFVTGVFGAISNAMFTKRPKSPDVQYFDCCDTDSSHEMPPPNSWHSSKIDELNKTLATDSCEVNDNMNDSKAAVAQCESKLNAVRSLLSSETVVKSSKSPQPSRLRSRRPKRVFVQPDSLHNRYKDDFATEEFVSLPNEGYIEYISVNNNISIDNCEVQAPKMKTEIAPVKKNTDIIESLPVLDKTNEINSSENCKTNTNSLQYIETTDIVKVLPQILETEVKNVISNPTDKVFPIVDVKNIENKEVIEPVLLNLENVSSNTIPEQETKKEVISSCEDKMAKLKSLLQRRKKTSQLTPIETSTEPKKPNIETKSSSNISKNESIKEVTKKLSKPIPITIEASTEPKTPAFRTKSVLNTCITECIKEMVTKKPPQPKLIQATTEHKNPDNKTKSLPNISITESMKEVVTKKPPKPVSTKKTKDKKIKNPCRLTDKRKHSKLRNNIQSDIVFANEIDSDDITDHSPKVNMRIHKDSVQNSPSLDTPISRSLGHSETPIGSVENDYFDEMKGRFHSTSTTDSEDSFQIVFTETPKLSRMRTSSDCDSEDSFIVFEDSPDSCYTSNEVFGDSDCESDESETDSEMSDSGCDNVCKLSPILSRTIGDLTDDSLFEDEQNEEGAKDEIDCAVTTFEEIPSEEVGEEKLPGMLIDDLKKQRRKGQPPKKVSAFLFWEL